MNPRRVWTWHGTQLTRRTGLKTALSRALLMRRSVLGGTRIDPGITRDDIKRQRAGQYERDTTDEHSKRNLHYQHHILQNPVDRSSTISGQPVYVRVQDNIR